ncbi:hypothetical protein EXVG_00393 [Emiliania huxleyi virus 202]|nr:hypothetical protein EXVG_00393 [Emiliania huxleyi virus 202]
MKISALILCNVSPDQEKPFHTFVPYFMSLPPSRIRKPSPKGIQDLPLELLPDIVDCSHNPPSANRALRDVWKRKCCTGLQMQLHALATTITPTENFYYVVIFKWILLF